MLTKSQTKVKNLVIEGLPNKTIANQLGIHEKTVKGHITKVYKLEQVKSRSELLVKELNKYKALMKVHL